MKAPLLKQRRKFLATHTLIVKHGFIVVRRVIKPDGTASLYQRAEWNAGSAPLYTLRDSKLFCDNEWIDSWSLPPRASGKGKALTHAERGEKKGPQVSWHMTRDLFDRIESVRGTTPRSTWIEKACERWLKTKSKKPQTA